VLVELGFAGGRTGCRTVDAALELARAVVGSSHLRLAGVEAFEGNITRPAGLDTTLNAVDALLAQVRRAAIALDRHGLFDAATEVIISAGGSAFPDRVVAALGPPWSLDRPVRTILRSGCYLTHDDGHYANFSPFGSRLPDTPALRSAMEIWGAVLSVPEPELAIIGFGMRDVGCDLGLPEPHSLKRPGAAVRALAPNTHRVIALNDQHAFMRLPADCDVKVGDLIACGISHPCTTFDKWRLIPLVDDDYRVLDAVLTYF
jgi:D-serine dehydratase